MTTHIPAHLADFWNAFADSIGGVDAARFYDVCVFGDSEALANELAELVLRGTKRATAGSVSSYEDEGKRIPMLGDLSIVTSWAGRPLCIIETESVEVVPFSEVSSEFAATEGEGDGSLSFWREAHRQYFTRECVRSGRQFSEDMLVACERFKVVYQPSPNAAQPVARADSRRQAAARGSASTLTTIPINHARTRQEAATGTSTTGNSARGHF